MNQKYEERLVVAFEKIAIQLGRYNDTADKAFAKRWPERKEFREAVVTRVPTEEDLIKEAQGASEEPIGEWIGFREKQFLEEKAKSATPSGATERGSGSTEAAGSGAGAVSVGSSDNTPL